jgi:hypothetical protein
MGEVARAFATDRYGSDFMLWREEQRAIGERMAEGQTDRARCIGFAAFDARYSEDFDRWLGNTRITLERREFDKIRLIQLHHALIDLGKVLDPQERRWRWAEWDPRDPRYDGPAIDRRVADEVAPPALLSREERQTLRISSATGVP